MTETDDDTRTDEPPTETDDGATDEAPEPKVPRTLTCADRRKLLAAMSAAGAASLAGCFFETPEARNPPVETNPEGEDNPDDNPADDADDEDGLYDVEFLEFGETVGVPDDQELLYAGLDQGWDIPYQCESGVCGVCTAKVDGDANDYVEHDGNQYLDDDQIEEGWVLTCVAYAEDDFQLMTSVHPDDDEEVEFEDVGGPYDVEFTEFGETIEVPEDQELLYAGLDQGWDLQYACEAGSCGQCTAKADGDASELVHHDGNQYLDDDQIEEGWVLTCVAYAEDEFALETNVHPDD